MKGLGGLHFYANSITWKMIYLVRFAIVRVSIFTSVAFKLEIELYFFFLEYKIAKISSHFFLKKSREK